MEKYESTKRAPVVLPKARLGPPYFIDKDREVQFIGIARWMTKAWPLYATKCLLLITYFTLNLQVPPDNVDALRRHEKPLVVHENAVSWTEVEREKLKKGVIAENRRMFIDQLIEAGEAPDSLPPNAVSDLDLMLNTKGLDWHRISEQFVSAVSLLPAVSSR